MAFSHGKSAALYVDDNGGTERNLTSYLTSTGISEELENADTSALGDTAHSYIAGLQNRTFPLEGHFDPTAYGYLNGILRSGAGAQFKYFPQGSASGKVYIDGTALITSLSIGSDLGGAATLSASFQVSGLPTFGTA